jgi:hypothetical protein
LGGIAFATTFYPPNIKGNTHLGAPTFSFSFCRSCLFASLLLLCSSFIHFHHLLLLFCFHCLLLLFTCFHHLLVFIAPSLPLLTVSPLVIVIASVACFHHLLLLLFLLFLVVAPFMAYCCFRHLFHHCPLFRYHLPTPFALFIVLSFILLLEL